MNCISFPGVSRKARSILLPALVASLASISASAAPLEPGTEIGVDFGPTAPTNFFNQVNTTTGSATIAAGSVIDTSNVVVDGVGFSCTGNSTDANVFSNDGADENQAGLPSVFNQSNTTDWLGMAGGSNAINVITLTFTGLDDSLTYDLIVGAAGGNGGNADTEWAADGQSGVADADTAGSSYVALSGLGTDGSGNLVITGTGFGVRPDVPTVSALQLTATNVPPPAPPPLPEGVVLNFDPEYRDNSVTAGDLDSATRGGTWAASLSRLSRFEDNTGGYAYVMDAANSQGDFVEVNVDGGGLDFSAGEVAIEFQMLASRASGTGDKDTTLIGYDGATEIFRLEYVSHTDNTQNSISVTTADGVESMGFTPLKWITESTLPSGFQDFRIVLSGGQARFSGSSLIPQDGPVLNSTQTLTSLRWEITGTSTADQGFWLDDLIVRESPPSAPRAATDRPNVIFILMDDMGYRDVGCYGATEVDTPNIDSLASGGLRFTHFHAAANICSPSRAAFLTGAYPQRCGLPYGINENRETHWFLGLNPDEITLPEQFRKRGYKTLMIGKWHLGSEDKFSYYNQGFDHYYGAHSNLGHNPEFLDETERIFSNSPEARLSSLYTQRIREHIRNYRDRPFFLYYAHQYPHTPYTEGNAFDGSTGNGTRADVIRELDWSVGQIVTELEASGILENTILIFTSDNGATSNTYCLPWRGTKFVTYEGGHRVPFIFYWKDQVQTPVVLDTPAVAMDLFPTLSELIQEPLPADRVYDGVSLVPLLSGQAISRPATEPFYYYNGENLQAVRQGDWKLHVPRTSAQRPFWDNQGASSIYRLYNLATDPGEATDVAGSNPSVVSSLTALADSVRLELGDYMNRGSEQGATGSLFPEVPVIMNASDWNKLSLEERGRGATQFRASDVSLGRSYTAPTSLPGGWLFLNSSEPADGVEVPLTPGALVGSEGNSGFIGTGATPAGLIGGATPGLNYVIESGNTGNNGVEGTDLLVVTDGDPDRDHVIVRYTVEEADVCFGHTHARISGSFRDLVGGSADDSITVHVFHNNTELFKATGAAGKLLQAAGTFDLTDVIVAANDTISFVIGSNGDRDGDEAALRTSIQFEPELPPRELALAIEPGPSFSDGMARLELRGTPGLSYRVERSFDLIEWEEVDEIPLLPASPHHVHVEATGDRGFWRAGWEQ